MHTVFWPKSLDMQPFFNFLCTFYLALCIKSLTLNFIICSLGTCELLRKQTHVKHGCFGYKHMSNMAALNINTCQTWLLWIQTNMFANMFTNMSNMAALDINACQTWLERWLYI